MSDKNKSLKINYKGFYGIDTRRCHGGKENLSDVNNFRILHDNTLEKRCGYRPLFTAIGNVRAVWSGYMNGRFDIFVLAGSAAYYYNTELQQETMLGHISTSSGKAGFFIYKGKMYLTDGNLLYAITPTSIKKVHGYPTVLGKNWGSTFPGTVDESEERNLLHGYVKISYIAEETHTSLFHTLKEVKSIISVWQNGNILPSSAYYFDSTNMGVVIKTPVNTGDRIILILSYDDTTEEQTDLMSCTSATVFGNISGGRLFMWGGNDKNALYINTPLSDEAIQETEAILPDFVPLYFTKSSRFTVGDGQYAVTSVVRHFDRLIIFTDSDAWIADTAFTSGEDIPTMTINTTAGCASGNGVVKIGNDPITLGKHSVLRWTNETDELNECNAYGISEKIEALLPDNFFKDAFLFADERKKELWICNASLSSDIWIYNIELSAWSRFSDIGASMLFDCCGEVGFAKENTLYVFDKTKKHDILPNGSTSEIIASITATNLDFDTKRTKKLSSLEISAELDNGTLSAQIETDKGDTVSASAHDPNGHTIKRMRLHGGRFNFIRTLTVELEGYASQALHELDIHAR